MTGRSLCERSRLAGEDVGAALAALRVRSCAEPPVVHVWIAREGRSASPSNHHAMSSGAGFAQSFDVGGARSEGGFQSEGHGVRTKRAPGDKGE